MCVSLLSAQEPKTELHDHFCFVSDIGVIASNGAPANHVSDVFNSKCCVRHWGLERWCETHGFSAGSL